MGLLERYVFRETLATFLVAALSASALMTLGGGIKEGIKQGLPPLMAAQAVLLLAPQMLLFTIPGCLLFAVCSVCGRLSASNELLAVRACGVSPLMLVWPALALSAFLSLLTFGLYDVCAGWARPSLKRLAAESIDQLTYGVLEAQGAFTVDRLSIAVKDVQGRRLIGPRIVIAPQGDERPMELSAREAALEFDARSGVLTLRCRDGMLAVDGVADMIFPGEFSHAIELANYMQVREDQASPSLLSLAALGRQARRERAELARLRIELRSLLPTEEAEALRSKAHDRERRLYRLISEPHLRLAKSFVCLCFAMVGAAIAISFRASDTLSVFFVCFLPILVIYYPLLVIGETVARQGIMPELMVWLADLVLGVLGGALLWKAGSR